MINPTGAMTPGSVPWSSLRQWVELDPANGGPALDDPFDESGAAPPEAVASPSAETDGPAG